VFDVLLTVKEPDRDFVGERALKHVDQLGHLVLAELTGTEERDCANEGQRSEIRSGREPNSPDRRRQPKTPATATNTQDTGEPTLEREGERERARARWQSAQV
jgi:hypothetical protein